MTEIVRERRYDTPPERLWELVDDPARMAEWFTFADRMELLSGTGVGRRQRLHGHWGKKRSEIDQLVIEHEPQAALVWRHEAERLDGKPAPRFAAETVFSVRLIPDGDGTLVRLESRQRPAGPVRGLVMRLFGNREIAENLERSLDELATRTP